MTDLLAASKNAFRTLRHHQADIIYLKPLQILTQLKAAIEEEAQRRTHIDILRDEIVSVLLHPRRTNSLNQAGEMADGIVALVTRYLEWDGKVEESQSVESS
jgi:hypothetical protein